MSMPPLSPEFIEHLHAEMTRTYAGLREPRPAPPAPPSTDDWGKRMDERWQAMHPLPVAADDQADTDSADRAGDAPE